VKPDDATAFPRVRLGVSACLLGEPVRYDGGHKRHAFLTDTLAAYADYLPLCPEAAIGLGIPRPPIHLVGDAARPRALGVKDPSLDVTEPLRQYALDTLNILESVSGYIFKKNSPSCGLRHVKVNAAEGGRDSPLGDKVNAAEGGREGTLGYKVNAAPKRHAQRKGTGIFAQAIQNALPLLPIEEEEALDNPLRLENFITRVYVFRRWQDLCADGISAAGLLDFHAAHKYLVMAHSQAAYKRLGQLLSNLSVQPLEKTAGNYIRELLTTLKRPARRSQHYNVLQHLTGYLKPHLNSPQKTRLNTQLDAYRQGDLPLIDAIDALKNEFDRFPDPYIRGQVYLYPCPHSLLLHIAQIQP
jgi:uncharacterized protein YbgA (DUF1722 family)/uncharacterized protein YbbK (DUF523 family)